MTNAADVVPNRSSSTSGGEGAREGASTLRVIAGFKFAEAALLIATGFGALGLLHPDVQHGLLGWLDQLSLHAGRHLTSVAASKALELLGNTTIGRLMLIGIGCFIYGGVFLVEGTGLWLRKRWAEYVTTIVTASLLPFELMELLHGPSAGKVATLVINVAVLVYLIRLLLKQRKAGA